jgi:DNA-binding NarL/FixJ family response regulator
MIGATKRVLVVENDDGIRESVVNRLRRRGFAADGAGTVAQTRALVTGQAAPFDVAVLDKAIQDPLHKTLTGFDLGHELRDAQPDMPPEFVVYSRHYKPEDYAQALELGISDYVVKSTNRAETIIDRIRLAALKSALNPVRPDLGERIERIAEKDLKVSTAVHQLCTEIIKPELDVCLGVPNIILISDSESIQVVNGNHRPGSERLYGEIQKGMLQHYGCTSFTFNKKNVPVPATAADIVNNLEGGSFVSFNVMDEAQLSIGILPPRSSDALSEIDFSDIELGLYVNPPIQKLLKYLSRIEKAVDASRRKILLGYTSRFCLYVAQTQLEILNEVAEDKELSGTTGFQRLKKLVLDLQATGNEFSLLSESIKQREAPVTTFPSVSVTSVVQRAWKETQEHFWLENWKLNEKGEDFTLAIEENDLFVAVLRVLQWFAQREDKVSTEAPSIDVEYSRRNDRLQISFTDQSRRLGSELRQRLFEPFTQIATSTKPPKDGKDDERPSLYLPLYLAKTLIDTKNKGLLEDRTDELPNDSKVGHRFTISFPAKEDNATT